MKICVVGLGYIGLPTASLLAASGHQVVGIDRRAEIIQALGQGRPHIEEPGLATVVKAAVDSRSLRVASVPEEADVFIICVQTPVESDRTADLRYVRDAVTSIVPHLRSGNLVILESTVPPGTTRDVVVPAIEEGGLRAGKEVHVAYCPERVLPGRILSELVMNDRIVGGMTPEDARRAKAVYRSFVEGKIHLTDCTTAEMVKVMENTFRDVNVALSNEMALIAEQVGVNVWEAIRLANCHPRVQFLRPGPGVGGHCLAVDPWFLVQQAPDVARLIAAAREVNDAMPGQVVSLAKDLVKPSEKPRIAILGLAYKAGVGDTRESPAVAVVEQLLISGVDAVAADPLVAPDVCPFPVYTTDQALAGADLLILAVDHDVFKELNPDHVADLMAGRLVLDTRSCLDRKRWEAAGFKVRVLGDGRHGRGGGERRGCAALRASFN